LVGEGAVVLGIALASVRGATRGDHAWVSTPEGANDDPLPVIETADSFSDLPRFTYRLDPVEVDQVHAALTHAGLPTTTLVPRRARATRS
jgi:hypothetical protein